MLRKSIPTTSSKGSSQRQLRQSSNSREESMQRKRKKFISKVSNSPKERVFTSVERSKSIENITPFSDHSTEKIRKASEIHNNEDSAEAYTQVINRVDVQTRPAMLHSEGR